ncbi:RNA polymerase sigma-70 factor [Mucilaginibacter daejeonensis]|uniref:RNA polymerase sigma factor n=1 Tax=Mucilaginibacter daejeonensis TaxID=398049 RepID=UPI001D17AE6D|nr:RNA polymerase sigma-70 factor [Mucilaginibacter daejeonensis]UEG53483.1 RNA polymerase sigma-70 factor [Mucilaginibacter daejeonensis]
MYTQRTDEELVELLKLDDDPALKALFHRYYKLLCNVSTVYTRDHAAAEEIVANLFMRLWDNRHSSAIQHVKSYLLVSVKNLSLNYLQKKKEPVSFVKDIAADHLTVADRATPFHIISGRETYDRILAAIDTLPSSQRQVLLMSRVDHLSKHEISETLGISVRTVETTLYQSIQKLRMLLKGRYDLSGN